MYRAGGKYMGKTQQFVVLSNISVEPFFIPFLKEKILEQGILDKITYVSYQEYMEGDYLDVLKDADAIIVWLNLEILLPEMHNGIPSCYRNEQEIQDLCHNMIEYISLHMKTKIFWVLFEDYFLHLSMAIGHRVNQFVEKVNWKLREELSEDITFIELKYLIAELGIERSFSAKNKFRWNFPYTKYLSLAVADEIYKQYLIENGISKKCLVIDCDNVLWGGILSEDGMENLKLGNNGLGWEYQEFQRFLLALYYRGVILAISSKNDLTDVLQVFHKHSGMILKEEYIACFQVNWENKPDNIRQIAEKLNIGMDSMVFVDDSSLELEAVKAILPEVTVIRYDRERMYREFSCFHLKENPDYKEVIKRNETYRTEMYRQEIKEKCDSYSDYLSALEMKVDIHEVQPAEFGRIAELTQRTNKCTNGVRCAVSDIKEWAVCKDVHLYTVTLADKFSDMGIVGTFGVRDSKLFLFSLSCRALGRELEDKMLNHIQERYRVTGFDFIDTGKNENIKMIFREIFPE